jgi:antitoxin component YwqK of YwqJK toxin-antitoxin module
LIHLITTSNHPAQHFEMNEVWILSDSQRVSDTVPTVRDVTAFEEHDPSGRLRLRWAAGTGSDGRYLLHGKETNYDQDGRIRYEVVYDRGIKVGVETLYRPDGSEIWSWDHHPEHLSTWTMRWSSARRKSESTWRGVRCHGVARCWNSAGLLTSEVEFEDGRPVSP